MLATTFDTALDAADSRPSPDIGRDLFGQGFARGAAVVPATRHA